MSDTNECPSGHVPKGAIIEDYIGGYYTALVNFDWSATIDDLAAKHPELAADAVSNADFDEETIQGVLFPLLVEAKVLERVEPNYTALTVVNRALQRVETKLLPISTSLRGPSEKAPA